MFSLPTHLELLQVKPKVNLDCWTFYRFPGQMPFLSTTDNVQALNSFLIIMRTIIMVVLKNTTYNIWILPMHSNVTSKNVSWLHFSWTTVYMPVMWKTDLLYVVAWLSYLCSMSWSTLRQLLVFYHLLSTVMKWKVWFVSRWVNWWYSSTCWISHWPVQMLGVLITASDAYTQNSWLC